MNRTKYCSSSEELTQSSKNLRISRIVNRSCDILTTSSSVYSDKDIHKSNSEKELKIKRNSRSEDDLLRGNFFIKDAEFSISETNNMTQKDKTDKSLAKALQIALEDKKLLKSSNSGEQDSDLIEKDYQYSSDCSDSATNMMPPLQSPSSGVVVTDSQGLIVPKKLINPCLESLDRKNLHRELLFNQRIGKNVLNQKTELQKVLEKQKERQFVQKENQETTATIKGELSRVIMERAERIEKKNTNEDEINSQLNPEYLNARAKLRATIDTK